MSIAQAAVLLVLGLAGQLGVLATTDYVKRKNWPKATQSALGTLWWFLILITYWGHVLGGAA